MKDVPDAVLRVLWDVDPENIDIERDRAFVMERVMTRGTWDAMTWLRKQYSTEALREFLRQHGASKLSPKDLAYWSLIAGIESPSEPGGGRPRWLK